MSARVLLVEDDPSMRAGLVDGFQFEGYSLTVATDGEEALRAWKASSPDLIILDVMLPKLSGLDVCKRIRKDGGTVPIIMLTARGQELDKVMGLKHGADDYVTKPFSFLELMARVSAVLRRSKGASQHQPAQLHAIGAATLDVDRGELKRGTDTVSLSTQELRLLEFFLRHPGQVISRDALLREVWGHTADVQTRTVDVHVAKLRKKLEATPSHPRHLLTVHNEGYKLVP
jgi:two-component system alkaline phosphatase synthesis response regulator PhoP